MPTNLLVKGKKILKVGAKECPNLECPNGIRKGIGKNNNNLEFFSPIPKFLFGKLIPNP